jgi:uncharacterized protein (TIGR02145 family)
MKNKIYVQVFLMLILVFISSCKKEVKPTPKINVEALPKIKLNIYSYTYQTRFPVEIDVWDSGYSTVTDLGIIYSEDSVFTQSNQISFGAGKGLFYKEVQLDFSSNNKGFFVKSYAVNSEGTAYSETKYIKNPYSFYSYKSDNVKDASGNSYETIKLGNGQYWMAADLKNLNTSNGTAINVSNMNLGKYGGYYYYKIVNDDVCPSGWRLPRNSDWTNLYNYITDSVKNYELSVFNTVTSSNSVLNVIQNSYYPNDNYLKFNNKYSGKYLDSNYYNVGFDVSYWTVNDSLQNQLQLFNFKTGKFLTQDSYFHPIRCMKE